MSSSGSAESAGPALRQAFGGVYIANEGFTQASAQATLDAGEADAVAFGKDFISNPDLPERLRTGAALTPWNKDTFYTPDSVGYTDYPSASEPRAAQ